MSELLPTLHEAVKNSRIRAIDYHFARFVSEQCSEPSTRDLAAATAFVLSQAGADNHVCIDLKSLAQTTTELYPQGPAIAWPQIEAWSQKLVSEEIASQPDDQMTGLMLLDQHRLYLARNWHYEQCIAQDLYKRSVTPVSYLTDDKPQQKQLLEDLFPTSEALQGETDWQRVAAAVSLQKQLTVITGGPGTGKTTTVVRLLALHIALHGESSAPLVIRLAAPTGKAAARMAESIRDDKARLPVEEWVTSRIPDQATTLHRLLGARPDSKNFRHNDENQILADVLVVDEVSMVDHAMMAKLLQAVPDSCVVIFLGDKDQLSSVEAGSVMAALCDSLSTQPGPKLNYSGSHAQILQQLTGYDLSEEVTPASGNIADCICGLRKVWRFNQGIKALADAINNGEATSALSILHDTAYPETNIYLDTDAATIAKFAAKQYQAFLLRQGEDPLAVLNAFDKFRVLCAMRKGSLGIENLNAEIEKDLVRRGSISAGMEFYPGRPVMVTTNDYNVKLYNGDIGLILQQGDKLYACFIILEKDESGTIRKSVRKVIPSRLPQHETAFAMTIHKSQGSGFENVAMVIPDAEAGEKTLSRELLYTGVTRAKKEVSVFADEEALRFAISKRTSRESGLSARLQNTAISKS